MHIDVEQRGFDTLVLSGGGPAGTAFVGCVRYLEHTGAMQAMRCFVGSSAGAMAAFMCVIGMSADEMHQWIVRQFVDGDLLSLDVEGVLEFPTRFGLDDGSRMINSLSDLLVAHVSGREDVTFQELAKVTGRELVVCAANITLAKHEFFSVSTTPDVSVLTAIRMSISVPLLFTPVPHRGCLYVDGSLFDNLPVDWVTRSPVATRALALNVLMIRPSAVPTGEDDDTSALPTTLEAYLTQLMTAVLNRTNAVAAPVGGTLQGEGCPPQQVHRVDIHCYNTNLQDGCAWMFFSPSSMAFEVSDELMQQLEQHGYDTLQEAMKDESISARQP